MHYCTPFCGSRFQTESSLLVGRAVIFFFVAGFIMVRSSSSGYFNYLECIIRIFTPCIYPSKSAVISKIESGHIFFNWCCSINKPLFWIVLSCYHNSSPYSSNCFRNGFFIWQKSLLTSIFSINNHSFSCAIFNGISKIVKSKKQAKWHTFLLGSPYYKICNQISGFLKLKPFNIGTLSVIFLFI